MEDESRTVITPDQPVTMGQLLQLFKQLNSNQPPTETVTNTHTLHLREINKPELHKMVQADALSH